MVGLQDSYHGDTLGAMDCGAPSPFNGPRQTPWYAGRGLFLAPPSAALIRGRWRLLPAGGSAQTLDPTQTPHSLPADGAGASFGSLEEVLSEARDAGPLAAMYEAAVAAAMDAHETAGGAAGRPLRLAALVMEPLVQVRS